MWGSSESLKLDIFKNKILNTRFLPRNSNNMWLLTKEELLEAFNIMKLWKHQQTNVFKSANVDVNWN